MTANVKEPRKPATIRPYGGVFNVLVEDEAGRSVEFMVQVAGSKLTMWQHNQKAVSADWPTVFSLLSTRRTATR